MTTVHQLLAALSRHIGRENGIGVKALAERLDIEERQVRALVSAARDGGAAICAHPTTGYFMAATDEELERYYIRYIEARSLHGLRLVSRARKLALPDYLGQLKLKT